MLSSSEDIELWKLSNNGDREAFGQLFRRHYKLLYQYGLKICPDTGTLEDAIQELFTDLWQKKSTVAVKSVKAYLLQALKFKLYKSFRNHKPVQEVDENTEEPFELSHDSFMIREQDDRQKMEQVLSTVNQLPPRQKEVLYLKIYKGMSYEEVSLVMDINYQAVRNLLCQALKTFRNIIIVQE